MERSSAVLAGAAAIVAGTLAAAATTSGAVSGFAGKGGPWSYLGATGNAAPSVLTAIGSCSGLSGIACVSNGLNQPAHISVIGNASGSAVSIGTARIQPNTLNLDPANGMVIARWTAPAAGAYDIIGSFTGDDIAEAPHVVSITDSQGSAPLLPATTLSAFGAAMKFSVPNVKFAVGDFVDFIAYATDGYTNLNTGLKATVTSADPPADVPEPGSLILLGSAALALGLARQARRWV